MEALRDGSHRAILPRCQVTMQQVSLSLQRHIRLNTQKSADAPVYVSEEHDSDHSCVCPSPPVPLRAGGGGRGIYVTPWPAGS